MFVELSIQLPVPLLQAVNKMSSAFNFHILVVSSATWRLSHLWNYSYISWLHQFNLFNVKVTFFSRKWIYWYFMILNKFKIFWVMVRVWEGGGGSKKTKNTSCILWKSPMVVQRGSILGHQPFLICINDLPSLVFASLIKYADCTKI